MRRTSLRAWASGAALLAGAGVVVACTLLNPLDAYEGGSRDAGADGAAEAGADAADGGDEGSCARSRWPARPAADDPAGDAGPDVMVVNALVTFGTDAVDGGVAQQGYDLDGVCTCPGPESCTLPAGVREKCDEDGGVDDYGGPLLARAAQLDGKEADVNARLASGDYGLLTRIRGYNGAANDTKVELAVFLSNGAEGIQDGGVPPTPRHDGTDRWTLDPQSLVGGVGPPYVGLFVDPNAYVRDHVVVATIDHFPIRLGRMTVELAGSVLTGTLTPDAVGWHIDDGRIAARLSAGGFLTGLAVIDDPVVKGGHLCGSSVTYQQVKSMVCAAVDISSDPKQDGTGAPCDAISVSAYFTSSTAQLGSVFGLPAPPQPCGPQWLDDCPR